MEDIVEYIKLLTGNLSNWAVSLALGEFTWLLEPEDWHLYQKEIRSRFNFSEKGALILLEDLDQKLGDTNFVKVKMWEFDKSHIVRLSAEEIVEQFQKGAKVKNFHIYCGPNSEICGFDLI